MDQHSATRTVADLKHEAGITLQYTPMIEMALECKIGGVPAQWLLIIAGAIQHDPEIWKRGMQIKPEDSVIFPHVADIVATFSREENLALRARVCKKLGMRLG
jgi:hypothetical protein